MGIQRDQYLEAGHATIMSQSARESIGSTGIAAASGLWTSSLVWTANKAVFIPFYVRRAPFTAKQMYHWNGSAVSGNYDIGIYDLLGNQLTALGSTAQAGTSALQASNIPDVTLDLGVYYMAFVLDNSTGAVQRANVAANLLRVEGAQEMASAFPLPNPATYTPITVTTALRIGVTYSSVI